MHGVTDEPRPGAAPGALADRVEAIRRAHLPDSRVGVWDVAVEENGRPRVIGWTTAAGAIDELRRAAREAGAEAVIAALPDPTLGAAILGTAHRALAHVRREPRHGSELVSQVVLGEEVVCLRSRDDWLQVQCADGYTGWVHRGSLVRSAPREERAALGARLAAGQPPEGTLVLIARSPVARAGPAPDAPPACDLVHGARVLTAGETEGGAIPVLLPDGLVGWIDAGAAVPWESLPDRFPPTGEAILAHAALFLGVPYLWGGASEKGYDCSGIVQRIYGLHGIMLPRDSDQQEAAGEPVTPGDDWSAVQDGDLAFFHDSPGGRATHVGILARGGRLLHASTTRNGVAWDALAPADPDRSEFGALLASRLSAVRRVLA